MMRMQQLSEQSVAEALSFDADQIQRLRRQWLHLLDLAVWGALHFDKLGALPRLRKRLLEVGENLRSLSAPRDWIPQPRERLKSALGSSIKLRDSLLALERVAASLAGGEAAAEFEQCLLAFRQELLALLERCENRWAELLDSQYDDAP